MVELPSLYVHQETMRDDIRAALANHKRAILCAPPGTGKTRLAKWIMGSYANRDKRGDESGNAIFAVHRRGLVDNASNSFNEDPVLPHGIIMAGSETSPYERLQVASIDTKTRGIARVASTRLTGPMIWWSSMKRIRTSASYAPSLMHTTPSVKNLDCDKHTCWVYRRRHSTRSFTKSIVISSTDQHRNG